MLRRKQQQGVAAQSLTYGGVKRLQIRAAVACHLDGLGGLSDGELEINRKGLSNFHCDARSSRPESRSGSLNRIVAGRHAGKIVPANFIRSRRAVLSSRVIVQADSCGRNYGARWIANNAENRTCVCVLCGSADDQQK